MKPRQILLSAFIAVPLHLFAQQPASTTKPYEFPSVFEASKLLPAEVLQGPNHRVREHVVTDGYMAYFEIDTDFGVFQAVGIPQVYEKINEANALRLLADTSKSDLFAEGMKRSISQPIDAVKNIVTDPVDSLKAAPATVGHFFSKVGSSIGRGAEKVKRGMSDEGQSPTAAELGESTKRIAGFDKAKLDTAKQLGVDPYTDNKRLQEEMDKVTWAFFAGGLPLRIGVMVASAGVAVAATEMVGVPEETYALTQSELALRDKKSLESMGIRGEDIDSFQLNKALSTTRRHRIVKAMEVMPKIAHRGQIILLANSCESSQQADFLIAGLSMLATRQLNGTADYKEIKVIGRLPGAVTATGVFEIPAPVDYVAWTEQVAHFAQRDDLGVPNKTLIHTGTVSTVAQAGFAAAGWTLKSTPYPVKK
jgi:hypothetical protein